jgi:catalase
VSDTSAAPEPGKAYEPEISGRLRRATLERENNYAQAGERYRTMPDDEREEVVLNLVDLLGRASDTSRSGWSGTLRCATTTSAAASGTVSGAAEATSEGAITSRAR